MSNLVIASSDSSVIITAFEGGSIDEMSNATTISFNLKVKRATVS